MQYESLKELLKGCGIIFLEELLVEQGISVRALSKRADIPYTTMLELVRGKKALERAAAETVYRISIELDVTMEKLVIEAIHDRERRTKETANE